MYDPKGKIIDTTNIELPQQIADLAERLAENTHDVWALGRMNDGWTYGETRDDAAKKHPCLVPYDQLSDSEKEYDRRTSMETLKAILKLGFCIEVCNVEKEIQDVTEAFKNSMTGEVERIKKF